MAINAGAVAEQVIAQELIASANPHEDRQLYFWARDKKSSQAEIDYLVNFGGKIIPIEVKAGSTGAMKSLKIFMEENQSSLAIQFSTQALNYYDKVLSLPLYVVGQMKHLIENKR